MLNRLKLLFTPPNAFIKLIQLRWRGMLYEEGWFEAACYYKPINKNLEPIPWWSYSFNDFFIPRLKSDIEVFEWGSGSSTLFLAKRVKNIISIEHDKSFIIKDLPKNAVVKYYELNYNGEYSKAILNENKEFDLVIVDGRDRVNCVKNGIKRLKKDGVIILDDSQRENYQEAKEFMKENGFKWIDFSGVAAGSGSRHI